MGQGGLDHVLEFRGPSRHQSVPPTLCVQKERVSLLSLNRHHFCWVPHPSRGTGVEVRMELSTLQVATHLWA